MSKWNSSNNQLNHSANKGRALPAHPTAVVLGAAGGMGSHLVEECLARGIRTVAFGRSREKLERLAARCSRPELLTLHVGDAFAADDVAAAAAGADIVFHAVSIPYLEWNTRLLPLAASIVEGVRRAGARLVDVDNIYPYGRSTGRPATEEHPKQPHTRKGRLRLELERQLMRADAEGTPVLIARLPDFYGAGAPNTLLHLTLTAIARGKSALYIGPLDVPREFIYLPDGARAVVELALREDAYGETWHIPGAGVITGREIARIAQQAAGGKAKPVRSIGRNTFRLLGVFQPFMREMVEMQYLTEQPFVLSGEKYARRIGPVPATPYEQGIRETVLRLQEQL